MTQLETSAPSRPSSRKHRIFTGLIIHSQSLTTLTVLPNASIGILPSGTIAFIDTTTTDAVTLLIKHPAFAHADIVALSPSQLLTPGLIDTHTHAPQWPNLALGMDMPLREWLETLTDPTEASYADTAKAARVYDSVVRTTLAAGSTTVAYNSTIHVEASKILADACMRRGQRAVVGKMCTTLSNPPNREESVEESLRGSEGVVEYVRRIDPQGRLLTPSVMPRGGPYCPAELMKGLGKQSGHPWPDGRKLPVQGHMCETVDDTERTLDVHPRFGSCGEMYDGYGLLHEGSVMAHCIHLEDRDLRLLKETRAGVAHCPNSNTCLTDGVCRVRTLLEEGIKVGLGTDVSAGYGVSVLSAMRAAADVSRYLVMRTGEGRWRLEFEELVYMATLGGAEVLGMGDTVGSFEVGKVFDALVVDVEEVASVDLEGDSEIDLLRKWVFLGDDRNISRVYVGGVLVAEHDL